MNSEMLVWGGFFALFFLLIGLDLFVFHRGSRVVTFSSAVGWTIFWVSLGMGFAGFIYVVFDHAWIGDGTRTGSQAASEYLTGYMLEESLSADNVFVMAALIGWFRIPAQHQHRVLFWGILGAIVFRGAMIAGGIWLTQKFTWLFYLLGAFLVFTGIKLALPGDEDDSPENSKIVRSVSRVMRVVHGDDHDGAFIKRRDGKLTFTILALALACIEVSDVIFAVDSVPAVLAVTNDSYIALTSNIFAILGLRSLYFVVVTALAKIHYLRFALAAILSFIGAKMILHDVLHIDHNLSLAVVGGILAIGIAASLIHRRREKRREANSRVRVLD
ncbi:MAG TPA: TerC family protein [Kofleriaceae bacterium]|nr:TerC family protein [Kofleriaceae bacterium]